MHYKKKENIVIFGAGMAGQITYKRFKRKVNILGFVDNDKKKIGQFLFKKPIYPPQKIKDLPYDRIIIASMYYSEIMAQLITEIKVPNHKITIDTFDNKGRIGLFNRLISKSLEYFICLKNDNEFRFSSLAAYYYHKEEIMDNYIMYESSNGRDFAGNPYALFKYLVYHKEYQHFNHVIAINDTEHPKLAPYKNHPRVVIVKIDSDSFIKYAESCKYYINNVSFRPYIIKKEGQVYVNTWHSTLLKKLAVDSNHVWESKNISRGLLATDYFISPNRYTTENLFRSYGVDSLMQGTIAEIGYPRNDLIYNTDKELIRKKLNIPRNKKLILFAPTWRGQYIPENTVRQTLDYYHQIKKNISGEYHMIVKFHTMVYRFLDHEALKLSVPLDIDTNELLAVTDILITDYSGILFDFLITGKPIILFTPDRQDYYNAKGGFYLDLNELPGPICDTIDEVIKSINDLNTIQKRYASQYESSRKRFVMCDDGQACERAANLIFKKENYKNTYKLTHKRKNILIYPGNLFTNGVTTSFLALLNHIDYTKYNIVVLLPDDSSNRQNQRKINKNAKVFYQITIDGYTRKEYAKAVKMERVGLRHKNKELVTVCQRNMRRIFCDTEFDTVINFSGYAPLWAAKICFGIKAKKKVIYLHNDLNEDRKIKNPALHSVFSLYKYYDNLFCVSKDSLEANLNGTAAYVKRTFGDDIKYKMDYINNLVLPDKIKHDAEKLSTVLRNSKKYYVVTNPISSEPNSKYSIMIPLPSRENINFISIGRLSPEKNHLRLLHAFHKVQNTYKDVRLYIVGQGVMKNDLENFVRDNEIHNKVVFTDYLHNPYPLLKLCDCLVLSSDIEGQGLVILEALILDTFVISTDIPGPHDILKNGDGILVTCSADALADAMLDFIENRKLLGKRKFNPDDYVNKAIQQFYEKVLTC